MASMSLASPTTDDDQKPPLSATSSSYPKERRFKLSRACDRCRRRRIRCDEGHPCQSCLAANSACTFEEPGKRTHPHKSKRSATLEDRMHHLESLIQSIPSGLFHNGTSTGGSGGTSQLSNGSDGPVLPNTNVTFTSGVPPPSLSHYPLTNPSTHFPLDELTEATSRLSIAPTYLYFDDEGSTRWQGETSGLPLLDLLVERATPTETHGHDHLSSGSHMGGMNGHISVKTEPGLGSGPTTNSSSVEWFPDRTPKRVEANPETLWKLITARVSPDLMDSLVQCFLSTTHYLMPFLHVPSFLADYGNPLKWGEPGFACFILAICAISSRHVDDPRVRSDTTDSLTAGLSYFELFNQIRSSTTDRPTMYTIQGVFVAAVYGIGLGKLSKASALLAEAITLSIDAGIHRSADAYDLFDPIEDEVRKRTFFCVYLWDKQAGAAFGRPPMIRLRDADVPEPALIDDEFITNDRLGPQPPTIESRMGSFVWTLRLFVVLESVLDTPPTRNPSPFRMRASSILSGFRRNNDLREEEVLLDEIMRDLPAHWKPSAETSKSEDVIRITQSQRIHCLEQFIRMLIQRHRFSEFVTQRWRKDPIGEQTDGERDAMMACHACALRIVESHMHMASSSLMTYYGVHVIHQLTQAGRTLVAILLNCKTEDLKPLVPPSLEALRSCVGLLRRFSGRYVCGLRNGDLIEEFCRLTRIPLDAPQAPLNQTRPAWLRPVPKKSTPVGRSGTSNDSRESSDTSSPAGMDSTLYTSSPSYNHAPLSPDGPFAPFVPSAAPGSDASQQQQQHSPQAPPSSASYLDPIGVGVPIGGLIAENSLSPAEFMALLNEQNGGFDIGAMFHPGMIQSPSQQQQQQQHSHLGINPTFMNTANGMVGHGVGVLTSP